MSRAYKCDGCGNLFEAYIEGEKIKQITVCENTTRLKSETKTTYDVCKECLTKIEKILNQNAKKVQSDKKPDCFGTYDEIKCENKKCNCKVKKECIEITKEDEDLWN